MKSSKWTVYILKCGDGSLYTGITLDVAHRIKQHASGKGSKYLRSRLPLKLVYSQKVPDQSSALRREAEIKSWPRRKKLEMIQYRQRGKP